MAVEERDRRLLQEALVSSIGSDSADTLMGYLPPVGWADVATKDDLRNQRALLRADLHTMRKGLRADLATMEQGLRADLVTMEQGRRADMATMDQGLRADVATMEQGLRADLARLESRMHTELRTQFYWTATLMVLLTAFTAALKFL